MKSPFRKPVLAAQWDRTGLDYVLADWQGGRVTITAAGSIERVAEEGDTPPAPGELLRAELASLGVRHCELLVALGRGSVDVLPLHLPPAGDQELPTLVANQVVRDAGETAESGVIDYVPLDTPEGQSREVFAFAVDGATIDEIATEAKQAGLRPAAVIYRPLASVTLLQRLVPQSRRTMILVTLHDREADLTIVRNGRLLYTRTARLVESNNVGDIAAQLSVEVTRSLAAASLTADGEEQHLYVFGSLEESEQLVQDLSDELSLPASLLDPLRREHVAGSLPADAARLAPLVGLIHGYLERRLPLDFLHPKRPPAPPNYYRRGATYAAAVMALVAAGAYYAWDVRTQAAEQVAALRKSVDDTRTLLEKVQQKQAVVDAIWQWETDNVNWLDELYDLTSRLPGGQEAVVRRLTISPGRAGQPVIELSIQVRDPEVRSRLTDQLRDAFHDVESPGVSEQSASTDYPWQFETRITLRKREPEQYRESAPDETPSGDLAASAPGAAAQ